MNELNHCKLTIRDKLGEKSDSNLFFSGHFQGWLFLFHNPCHAPLARNYSDSGGKILHQHIRTVNDAMCTLF